MKKVLVFGVFDGLHEGHRVFLRQAKKEGDYLIAAVARDETVDLLKGHRPKKNLEARMKEVEDSGLADEVIVEDEKLGTWEVVGKHNPHVIALGYDQKDLKVAILGHIRRYDLETEVRVMEGHEPEKYHSSLLNSKIRNQNAKVYERLMMMTNDQATMTNDQQNHKS